MCTVAAFNPARLAVTVIVPGESVERIETRLMPSSVFSHKLFVESTIPLL